MTGLVGSQEQKLILQTMGTAVKSVTKTNVFCPDRMALSFMLDPAFFEPALHMQPKNSTLPYSVIFSAGRHYNGYHVRFRDVARGGLRVVLPPSRQAHVVESRLHFNECFGLAWAQQLKNKDIPEGGSKAVCLVHPSKAIAREDLLHSCVKKFVDSILDLITPDPATSALVVDRAEPEQKKGNLIYLGPDENITPFDIEWVVSHAEKRGYPQHQAFMSSKPRIGINHKDFGVTSEGVAVFLDVALKAIGINPSEQPFTIKLTGGPDGDVAGNMLSIMHREYGDNAKVVGIVDATAVAEDPDGIPMKELLRLVKNNLPLSHLKPDCLGSAAYFSLTDNEEGKKRQNTMHNTVKADVFVPAGGRPATVNGSNWQQFLLDDSTPSAKCVVEGANLFFTPEARSALFQECRLPIVKDSSANKCGVICSSLEILASMSMSQEEVLSIREAYIPQVLDRLRDLAGSEARLLFSESMAQPDVPLPELSERISFAIIKVTDALSEQLDKKGDESRAAMWPLLNDVVPPALYDKYGDKLPERLPWEYTRAILSSGLASRLVYNEGLQFVENLPQSRMGTFALQYLDEEQKIKALISSVSQSGMAEAATVESILRKGGARASIEMSPLDC